MTSNGGLVEAPESSEAVESAGLPGVRLVRRRLRWVALAAGLGLAVGGLLSLVRAPSYESTVFLSVTSSTVADAGSVARSAQAIARIATSPGVVGEPLRDAGLVDQAAAPRRYVSVQAAPDAPLISITGTSDDARTAQLTTEVVTGTLEDLGAFEDYAVTAIGTAPVPTEPRTPQWVGPVGGVVVAAGIALVMAATVPARGRRDDDTDEGTGLQA
jgi:capsular polysaccharide biosynthesis protein